MGLAAATASAGAALAATTLTTTATALSTTTTTSTSAATLAALAQESVTADVAATRLRRIGLLRPTTPAAAAAPTTALRR